MANINDFKLISAKSKKYFELLSKALEIDLIKYGEITQERYGFYLYLLESICGIKDLFDLTEIITDTEFNTSIFDDKYEDYGIDAIYIDEDAKKINLFNFKYRERFNSDRKQSINDTILSTKFINALINEDVNSEILVRVFKTISDKKLINKIAEYTNSQNSISNVDLKSLSTEQIQLEQYLDEKNIIYSRKNGDTGISNTKQYEHKISMERFGQILFSIKGYPEKASNQKKQIFDKYYDELFGENNLVINESDIQIKKYFEVKKAYEKNTRGYESSDQKVFYIL